MRLGWPAVVGLLAASFAGCMQGQPSFPHDFLLIEDEIPASLGLMNPALMGLERNPMQVHRSLYYDEVFETLGVYVPDALWIEAFEEKDVPQRCVGSSSEDELQGAGCENLREPGVVILLAAQWKDKARSENANRSIQSDFDVDARTGCARLADGSPMTVLRDGRVFVVMFADGYGEDDPEPDFRASLRALENKTPTLIEVARSC